MAGCPWFHCTCIYMFCFFKCVHVVLFLLILQRADVKICTSLGGKNKQTKTVRPFCKCYRSLIFVLLSTFPGIYTALYNGFI